MRFDFFLLTALDVERKALLKHLREVEAIQAPFFRGTITNDDGDKHDILVAQSSESGTNRAAALTATAIVSFQPRHVLLVGIAAGLSENGIHYGDVLVPGWVHAYEKLKKMRVKGRPKIEHREWPLPTAQPLVRIARHIVQGGEAWWKDILESRPDCTTTAPTVHASESFVLGSGDKLLADEKVQERRSLQQRYKEKALGFEMEAAGAALACWQEAVPFAVVKGVQDYGTSAKDDPETKDQWRSYAAEAASVLVVHMLQKTRRLELKRTAPDLEKNIYEKAQAEFALRRIQGKTLSARSVDGLVQDLVNSWRHRGYGPKTIMAWSRNARIEHCLIPLLQERIEIEVELRRQYRAPFTEERIDAIRKELINLAEEEWQTIVYDAFEDTMRGSGYLDYKVRELEAERDGYLRLRIKDGGKLLTFIDQSLRNAKATVSLAAE